MRSSLPVCGRTVCGSTYPGATLVVQTMPQALLEQSKATLRATFSAIMRKRVFTLPYFTTRMHTASTPNARRMHAACAPHAHRMHTACTLHTRCWLRRRVFTLSFERSSELGWGTVEKLLSARHNRGVVLCTGSTIKSLQLKLLERMDVLRDTRRKQHPSMEVDLRGLVEVMQVSGPTL